MLRLRFRPFVVLAALVLAALRTLGAEPAGWQPAEWNGERVFAGESHGWRAVVSIDRARLVFVGRAGGGTNLLFAPAKGDDVAGWGGHRVWLGPQARWNPGWPPPKSWEHDAPESVSVEGTHLLVTLAEAGDGWPRLVREYFWADDGLHCNARISGGHRPAQIIHIVQVPDRAEVVGLQAASTEAAPHGYVLVHLGRHPSPQGHFQPPPHVTTAADGLHLHFTGVMEKLGFTAQPLHAQIADAKLTVARGASAGQAGEVPDDGFCTQVYLGQPVRSPVLELEQLSPMFPAGAAASFEIVIAPE